MMTIENDLTEFETVQKVRRFLLGAQALNRVFEETLIDLVAAYTPALAPLIPAGIGFVNVQAGLGFDPLGAFVYAAIVEFLGLATIKTVLDFRAWNVEKVGKPAPFWIAFGVAVFYLVVMLAVNVLLDTGTDLQKWVKGLASSIAVAGAITLGLRNEHAKRVATYLAQEAKTKNDQIETEQREKQDKLDEIEQAARIQRDAEDHAEQIRLNREKIEYERQVADEIRRQSHNLKVMKLQKSDFQKVSESPLQVSAPVVASVNTFPETFGKWTYWNRVPDEYKRQIAEFIGQAKKINASDWKIETVNYIQSRYGVIEKTAYNWIDYAERDYPALTAQGGA